MNKKISILLPSLFVALFILLLMLGLTHKSATGQRVMQPKALPNFQLSELQTGKSLTKSLFVEPLTHHYTLLNIWASWCAVCKIEHPFLLKLAQQGVFIVGLNYRDDQQAATSLLLSTGNPYQQVIFDPKGTLALNLGVVGTPESYLIDQYGQVIARFNGVLNDSVWENHFKPMMVMLTDVEQ
ncbi:MAG: DsbE family thiol:disulfide interchange protein [Psychromonas sp.]